MKRPTRLFSKLIVCKYCGKFHRFQQDNIKKVYLCSRYSREGKCRRNAIDESVLIQLITNHFYVHNQYFILENQFLKEQIEEIVIAENEVIVKCKTLPDIISNETLLSFVN